MREIPEKAEFNIPNINQAVYLVTNFRGNLPDDLLLINRNIQNNCNNQRQYNRQKYFQDPEKICKLLFQTEDLVVTMYGLIIRIKNHALLYQPFRGK